MGKPERIELSAGTPRGEGLRRIIAARGAELQRLEAPLRAPESATAEEIHDGRVASRRLRAALRLYPLAPRRLWEDARTEVRALGRALGALRDLDVRAERLAETAAGADDEARVGLRALAERQAHARTGTMAALAQASARFFGPGVLSLRAALGALDAGRGRLGGRAMRRRLRKRLRRTRRLLPAALPGAPDHVHALRIALKKLRYHGELLRDVDPWARALIEPLPALQDRLGALHDADAELRWLVEELARAPRAEQAGLCLHLQRCHAARARLLPEACAAMRAWQEDDAAR